MDGNHNQLISRWREVVVGVATIFTAGALLACQTFFSGYLAEVPPKWQLRLLALLVIVIGVLATYILHLRPNLRYDKELGIYRDLKGRNSYCPSCIADKRVQPLLERESGWYCQVTGCKFKAVNPDYKPPKKKRPTARHSSYLGSESWRNEF